MSIKDGFQVLVADPPWAFTNKLPGLARGAAKHYTTMRQEAIKAFPLPSLAENAVLFLWRVAAMQHEALAVVDAWGFKLKTEIVWIKLTQKGDIAFGMGHITRGAHETCLVATRGRPKVKSHSIQSVFEAPRLKHSQKPEEFFDLVEKLYDGPYCELFARRKRPGWTCLGNDVNGFSTWHVGHTTIFDG